MIGLTPDITEAAVVRHGVLHLRFADGLSGEVEVLDRMRGPVFEQARTPEGFAEATVDPGDRHGRLARLRRPCTRHPVRTRPHRRVARPRRRRLATGQPESWRLGTNSVPKPP